MTWSKAVEKLADAVNPSNIMAIVLAVALVAIVWFDKSQMNTHLQEIRELYRKRLELEERESVSIHKLIEKLTNYERRKQ